MCDVLFIRMGGRGWGTAPTTAAAPLRRMRREFGAEKGDKGRNTSVLSTSILSPEMCNRSAAFCRTAQGLDQRVCSYREPRSLLPDFESVVLAWIFVVVSFLFFPCEVSTGRCCDRFVTWHQPYRRSARFK